MEPIARTIDPAKLAKVQHSNGRAYFVIARHLEDGRSFLNTYTRTGNLKVSRRCTVPVGRDDLVDVAPVKSDEEQARDLGWIFMPECNKWMHPKYDLGQTYINPKRCVEDHDWVVGLWQKSQRHEAAQ